MNTAVSLLLCLAFCCGGIVGNAYGAEGDLLKNRERLIQAAGEIAESNYINVGQSYVVFTTGDGYVEVRFMPKVPSQRGGSGSVFFRKEPKGYVYSDIKLRHVVWRSVPEGDKKKLIELTREIAQLYYIDVNKTHVDLTEEGTLTVVRFVPAYNNRPGGGGGEFSFKKEQGKYVFFKFELSQ